MQTNSRIRVGIVAWLLAGLTASTPLSSAGSYPAGEARLPGTEADASATEIHEVIQENTPGSLVLSYRWSYSEASSSRDLWRLEFSVAFSARPSLNKDERREVHDQWGSTDTGAGNMLLTWFWSEFAGRDAGGLNRAHATRFEASWCCGEWSVASEAEEASPIEVKVAQVSNPSN